MKPRYFALVFDLVEMSSKCGGDVLTITMIFVHYVSTEWSTIPACPSLMCFFNRGDTEGTNFLKMLCSMFVYVLFYINLCQN